MNPSYKKKKENPKQTKTLRDLAEKTVLEELAEAVGNEEESTAYAPGLKRFQESESE